MKLKRGYSSKILFDFFLFRPRLFQIKDFENKCGYKMDRFNQKIIFQTKMYFKSQ